MKKANNKANGGNARAAKLSPETRKEIASNAAKKRWEDNSVKTASNLVAQGRNVNLSILRDQLAIAVLQGLYSDITTARELVINTLGEAMPLMEGFTRIAYTQADEVIRLRAL